MTPPGSQAGDGALKSGMEHGMALGYDRLDGVLGSKKDASRGS